jgi:hypothetical protein
MMTTARGRRPPLFSLSRRGRRSTRTAPACPGPALFLPLLALGRFVAAAALALALQASRCRCEDQQQAPSPVGPTFPSSPAATTTRPAAGSGLDCSFRGDPIQLSETVTFQHILNEVDGTLTVELTYQGTAWVGVGVSPDGQMVGSQVVIAKPDEAPSESNPARYSLEARQQDAVELASQRTLIEATYEQTGGVTVLRFKEVLAINVELPISASGSNTFVYAVGSSNTFGYHAQRGSFTLPALTGCTVATDEPTTTDAPATTAPAPPLPVATASPAAGASCPDETAALASCVSGTGDAAGCGLCLERYMGFSDSRTCEGALEVTCRIETACPECGTCQSEFLALLQCSNDGLCGDDAPLECPPAAPAPPGVVPSFTYDCPAEFSESVSCLRYGSLDAEACYACYQPYELTVTNETTCGELAAAICGSLDECAPICGGCWPSLEKEEACRWGSGCFEACPPRTPSEAAPVFPTSSAAPVSSPPALSPVEAGVGGVGGGSGGPGLTPPPAARPSVRPTSRGTVSPTTPVAEGGGGGAAPPTNASAGTSPSSAAGGRTRLSLLLSTTVAAGWVAASVLGVVVYV